MENYMKKIFSFLLLLVALQGSAQHWNYTPGTFIAPGGVMATSIQGLPADTIHSAPTGSLAYIAPFVYVKNISAWEVLTGPATLSPSSFPWSVIQRLNDPSTYTDGPFVNGDKFLVGLSPAGAYAGKKDSIATYNSGSWTFTKAQNGDLLYNADSSTTFKYTGFNWLYVPGPQKVTKGGDHDGVQLRIGTQDNFGLRFMTNGSDRLRILASGFLKLYKQPAVQTTGSYRVLGIKDADSTVTDITALVGVVATLAPIGSSPNANGGTISGTTFNLQPANGSFGGVITTTAQTFAGDKTFNGQMITPNINGGANTDELTVWNSTNGFRHITPASYAKMILNQYATQQPASAWIDSIKAKERIISDNYIVGSVRDANLTASMKFDSTASLLGIVLRRDDKQASFNSYLRISADASDSNLFRIVTKTTSNTPKNLTITDSGTGATGIIILGYGNVQLGRPGGNQTVVLNALNASTDATIGGGIYFNASDAAPSITQLRGSSNTAGKDLPIKAGPAQTGVATNVNAGDLNLGTDVSKGTGTGNTNIFSTPSGGGGDNSPTQKIKVFGDASVLVQDGGSFTRTPSALFEVNSNTQGLLLPRMTKTQRDAIASPVAGLAIYQTDNTPGLRVYNGTNWMKYTETTD